MNNENKFTMELMNQEINCKYVNQLPPTSREAFVGPEMRLGRSFVGL